MEAQNKLSAQVADILPPAKAMTAPLQQNAGFMDGSDGTVKMAWARYSVPFSSGYAVNVNGSQASREGRLASAVANDLASSNPVIATILETLETFGAGTGLTLSSKPRLQQFGVSREDERAFSDALERAWNEWAGNPSECDLTGRFDLHQIAASAFRSYLLNGEALATLDWRSFPGCKTMTKFALLDSKQLDYSKTLQNDVGGVLNGVQFNKAGRVIGYWIIPAPIAGAIQNSQSIFVPKETGWGRAKVLHIFDLKDAKQVRGLSPLAAALTPAHERESLGEFTLANALLQTQFALSVESDLPAPQAIGTLSVNNEMSGMADYVSGKQDWYSKSKINPQPGTINHLAPGDKLKFNRSETPNSTFKDYDRSLTQKASRAAGESYESVSGDFSQTSFSASRWASEAPYRLMLKRRRAILDPFYKAVFDAWLEEQIETGRVELPRNAPPFWAYRSCYTNARWLGASRPEPDRAKAASATERELANGLISLTDALAERGLDFEGHMETLQSEKQQLEAIGLRHPFWSEKVAANKESVNKEEDDV